MSIFCYEAADSPEITRKASKGSSASARVICMCDDGEFSGQAISAALAISAPTVFTHEAILIRNEAKCKTMIPLDANGRGVYEVTIEYGEDDDDQSQERGEPGTWHYSFDTTGGTHHVTQSEEEIDQSDTDMDGIVGWDGKEAKGVDVVVPQLSFEITAYYHPRAVTTQFVASLARATGKVNSDAWLGFAAGELLFMGASGQGDIPTVAGQRLKPVPINLKFAASENRTSIVLNADNTVPSKKGWEYLDVQFHATDDSNAVIPKIKRWSVHRLYQEMSFSSSFGIS